MDEFARLMSMEGVRPLDQSKEKPRSLADEPVISTPGFVATPNVALGGHAWVKGPRARAALETALERLAAETRDGGPGWAIGVRQDGMTLTLPASSGAAALLGAADRQSLRLMVIGGNHWTFVMHPLMGVATLDDDPA